MKKSLIRAFAILPIFLLFGCGLGKFKDEANEKFGDQHFKTAIALIELHKIRNGAYPENLDSIKYLGDWDPIIKSSVRYEKLDSGYSLDLINGWMGAPENLSYPNDFWQGIGLRKSNLKN